MFSAKALIASISITFSSPKAFSRSPIESQAIFYVKFAIGVRSIQAVRFVSVAKSSFKPVTIGSGFVVPVAVATTWAATVMAYSTSIDTVRFRFCPSMYSKKSL